MVKIFGVVERKVSQTRLMYNSRLLFANISTFSSSLIQFHVSISHYAKFGSGQQCYMTQRSAILSCEKKSGQPSQEWLARLLEPRYRDPSRDENRKPSVIMRCRCVARALAGLDCSYAIGTATVGDGFFAHQ